MNVELEKNRELRDFRVFVSHGATVWIPGKLGEHWQLVNLKPGFGEYYLPARAPGRLALLGWRASSQWQAGLKNRSFFFGDL